MIYLRKLFTQDLRDGKQIAFPKEPSLQFFNFDYPNKESERSIKFIFNASGSKYPLYDGKVISTRLYSASSESRIDGELKAFIRDFMDARVNDILCFSQAGKNTYEFKFIQQGDELYPLYLSLIDSQNHTVILNEQKENNLSKEENTLAQSTDAQEFVWDCVKEFYNAGVLEELLHSHWAYKGGNQRDYWVLNGCFCAYEVADPSYADNPLAFDDKWICDSFRVYGGTEDVKKFADAVNDVLDGKYKVIVEGDNYKLIKLQLPIDAKAEFTPYLTALRTKPFMLLAGISGTGKSRIAREIAKACWPLDSEQRTKQVPDNFCMVQVKPNWHDSTELLGYVSRINGEKYVVGDFTKFVAKAAQNPEIPYILCLDEMNLAPVEQYFAEYLSVVESRKAHADGSITTDPLIDFELTDAYITLINQLIKDENERQEYLKEKDGKRLTIPQNLFVIGTVNMDETTFSFSRKVLDRAMTIEMNEVNLYGGLDEPSKGDLGYIGNVIIGHAAEGKDVYADNKVLCDKVIEYLEEVNKVLEGTPFKIAYRTRNEFLLYAVNRQVIDPKSQVWQTLDEMTSMKILSRIEGDSERTKQPLEKLKDLVNRIIVGEQNNESISGAKIEEMLDKLQKTGYTSYWT